MSLAEKGVVPTIRVFEASLQFDSTWMNQHGISFGTCYETNNFKWLDFGQIKDTFVGMDKLVNGKTVYCVAIPYNAITEFKPIKDYNTGEVPPAHYRDCVGERWRKCTPKTVMFDIEANNRLNKITKAIAFSCASWTPKNYAERFKSLITNPNHINEIENISSAEDARSRGITLVATKYKETYCKSFPHLLLASIHELTAHLNENIPRINETDEATTIAFVVRQGDDGLSPYSPDGCYVFTWNHKHTDNTSYSVTRTSTPHPLSTPTEASYTKDCHNIRDTNNYFHNIVRRVYSNEFEMILGFADFIKSDITPDFLGGHNVFNFDLPFLIDRVNELARTNTEYKKRLIETPFTFGYLKGHQSRYWNSSYFRDAVGFKSSFSVETPGLSIMDTLSAFKNSNLGTKMDSYNLGALMVSTLNYPDNNEKMRKLEMDIRQARYLWEKGGDGQNYYEGYCIYDAVGAAMLCGRKNFISMAFTVAALTGVHPKEVYPRGVQNIVYNMVHLDVWNVGDTKLYLIPDNGIRELHFPDLWYAHMDPDKPKTKDEHGRDKYIPARQLYETVPSLKNKWEMGGIRFIPKKKRDTKPTNRNPNKQLLGNPFLPESTSKEEKIYVYTLDERKKKQKLGLLPKTKPYVGANVLEVLRMFIISIIMGTLDYESMYPTIGASLLMCYCNMVTEFIRRAFKIKRLSLCRVVLGPATLIQMGDILDSPLLAKQHDIVDTTRVVYTYFYQRRTTIVGYMIRRLIKHRRACKDVWAQWIKQNDRLDLITSCLKNYKSLLTTSHENNFTIPLDERNILEDMVLKLKNSNISYCGEKYMAGCYKKAEELLKLDTLSGTTEFKTISKAKEWIRWITFKHQIPPSANVSTMFMLIEPDATQPDIFDNVEFMHIIKRLLSIAVSQNNNYNVEQLGTKLTMNSIYGFLSMASGILPMIQIGSAITSYGRYLIKMTENVANNIDNIVLAKDLGIEKRIEEVNGGRAVDSFRVIGKNFCSFICGGDTDSVFNLFRPEFYPSPLGQLLIYGSPDDGIPSVAKAYANEINTFLPKLYAVDGKTGATIIVQDIMNIMFENAKFCMIELKKKMAAGLTCGSKKISAKGLSLKKSDTLPAEAAIEEYILTNILLKKPYPGENIRDRCLQAINYARAAIVQLMRGNYNPQQFVMKKKLKKPVELYDNPVPIHVQVARMKIARGETVVPDTFISYVYVTDTVSNIEKGFSSLQKDTDIIKTTKDDTELATTRPVKKARVTTFFTRSIITKAQTGTCNKAVLRAVLNTSSVSATARSKNYECADYAQTHDIQLDIGFYFNNFIIKKLARLLAPIISNYEEYFRIPYTAAPLERKMMKKKQAHIENEQIVRMMHILKKGEIEERMTRINFEKMQRSLTACNRIAGKTTSFSLPIRRCIECNDCFEDSSLEFKQDINMTYNYINEVNNAPGLYGVCPSCMTAGTNTTTSTTTTTTTTATTTSTHGVYNVPNTLTRRNYIRLHEEKLEEAHKLQTKCREKCWKCIDNARVSIKASQVAFLIDKHGKSVFNNNGLITIYKSEEERRSIYFTNPDQCTLDKCDVFIERKAAAHSITKENRCINILEQINDW